MLNYYTTIDDDNNIGDDNNNKYPNDKNNKKEFNQKTIIDIDRFKWNNAQIAEKQTWDEVMNSEYLTKQTDIFYRHAPIMDLPFKDDGRNTKVIDIGGGSLSAMLHFKNITGTIVDPILFDDKWIKRYKTQNIDYIQLPAEEFLKNYNGNKIYSEVWIYNCLQHVLDPEFILRNLWKIANVLRISEPCGTLIDTHHIHTFNSQWYMNILTDISLVGQYTEIEYDYIYCGGLFLLKNGVSN